jgi:rfaE bifunctional protein nucleotidyltransferase chain/domain
MPFSRPYSKLLSAADVRKTKKDLKDAGKTLVFTNGCFDLLHTGHVDYLWRAKSLGDWLLVGLNDDASVARLKGETRPILRLGDRVLMLSGLFMVDGIAVFPEDTPLNLILAVEPDVLVKGGDWKEEDIVGRDSVLERGGKVCSLPFTPGYSTTGLLEKIRGMPNP